MFRLALPVLCCAALLWARSGVGSAPRATCGAPAVVASAPAAPDAPDLAVPFSARLLSDPDEASQAPQGEVPLESDELRQHDVRDLVGIGLDVEELAARISGEVKAKAGSITTRVNVLEILAPEVTQLHVERFLEEKRRIGTCTLRIHPVADLVMAIQEYEELQASLREGTSIPADAFEELPEPASPFEIDSLVDVIRQTLGTGVAAITAQGRNLVVLAEPAAQVRIADFLDDLRSTAPPPPQDS